jgi:hypothetical protein
MSATDGGAPRCAVLPAAVVTSYGGGSLATAAAWSVEAHLPGCPACRAVLAGCAEPGRLGRNRAVLLVRAGLPEPGPLGRTLGRCGVPEHVRVLLAATPSLRRSWLMAVLLVLATAVITAQLASVAVRADTLPPLPPGTDWTRLAPFLLIAPLLPLAAVAAAFSQGLDPAYRLASAAPVSKAWLACVRAIAVVAATLVPTALAALALPGPWWLAVALLLPALALCAAALGLATVVRPAIALAGVAAGWLGVGTGLTVTVRASAAYGPAGQLAAAAVLAAGAALFIFRRSKLDYGWRG